MLTELSTRSQSQPRHPGQRNRRPFLLLSVLSLLLTPALHADVLWVADFDEGKTPIDIAATSLISDVDGSHISHAFVAHSTLEPALGNNGYSLKTSFQTGEGSNLVIDFGTPIDVTAYQSLSFWIRGNGGGERFFISLRRATAPTEPSFDPAIQNFLPNGITTSWQKVTVPLRALMSDFMVNSSTALSDINGIVFTIDASTPTETFYIDDILFHSKSAPVWVDNYSDGNNKTSSFGFNAFSFVETGGGQDSSLTETYDTAQSSSSPASLSLTWNVGSTISPAVVTGVVVDGTGSNSIGVDISGCDTLMVNILSTPAGNGTPLGLALRDDDGTESIHPTTITLTNSGFQSVSRKVSEFSNINSTSVVQVQFWLRNDNAGRGPAVGNSASSVVYADDIRFTDTISPSVPSALTDDGTTVANGHVFGRTNSITFSAGTNGSDPTLESIRFEHDNQTGGATWYRVFLDTTTSQASHRFTWDTSSLADGSSYRVRLVAMDIAGNESAVTFTGITVGEAETKKTSVIGKSGGTISLNDLNAGDGQTSLAVPEGALDGDTAITLEKKAASAVPSGPGGATPGAALEIGPSGTQFRRPSTLTLRYLDLDNDGLVEDPDTGAETSVNEAGLRLYTHDGLDWVFLNGTVDTSLNTVTGQITHLSSFALFPAAGGASAVKPKEKIITPAGSPGVNDALNFGGSPVGAKIEIHDVTGRLVRRLENQTSWNGRDGNGEIVESGVYVYRAEIGGEKVTGTVTVAR